MTQIESLQKVCIENGYILLEKQKLAGLTLYRFRCVKQITIHSYDFIITELNDKILCITVCMYTDLNGNPFKNQIIYEITSNTSPQEMLYQYFDKINSL